MALRFSPAVRRALFSSIGVVAGGVLAAFVWVPSAGWTTNDVTTGDNTYPDLTSHKYDAPPAMTATFAAEAATRLLRWKVVKREENRVDVEVPVPGGLFTDDLTVMVSPEENMSRVVIRSHSRVGRADLGMNARHIRLIQAAMDEKLPAAK